ncbi:MAG: tetratricopeptide repeat protein [Caulobacter sp.]|nr:tetratricopeptide repeat protein [Caulobacter sp.]
MDKSGRINGWKAIGAYFGRDRTTAIRWARDRGLPVHRLPGGKTATVYALKPELDAWARGQPASLEPGTPAMAEPATVPAVAAEPPPRRTPGRLWIAAALALLVAGLVLVVWATRSSLWPAEGGRAPSTAVALPGDAVLAERYLKASDLVGGRTAGGLEEAIGLFRDINRRDPSYAPAYAGLAEALLLSREFGMRRDTEVFPQARTAARTAIRLSPDLAAAHRALGFIAYWSDHDRVAAGAAFRRAIAIDPGQGLTHFWYGNVLSDNGDHAAARRELDLARQSLPGSVAVQTDFAWALWAAGDEAAALPLLQSLATRHPDFAVAHDCLAIVRLARGDYAGYAEALSRFAAARQDPVLLTYAGNVEAARPGGPSAMHRVMMAKALEDLESDGDMTRAWAGFLASVAGDRAALVALLKTADERREVWGDAGLVRRIKTRWAADREIQDLLSRRVGPRIA